MSNVRYILISPRGFRNEVELRQGTIWQVKLALKVINDNPNAWAIPVKASSHIVKSAKAESVRYRHEMIEALSEDDLRSHRRETIKNCGGRGLGGDRLSA